MSLSCGIDVGGTKIAGAVVDAKGAILEEARVESPATDREAIEQAIASLVADLRTRHRVESVGVGFAGYVDAARARVYFAPNLAMRDLDLKSELQEHIDLPVVIENDANSAAWGEFAFGAGEDVDDLLMVTVGTGVGGGLVLDGELYRGAYGVAAEIGHLRVVPEGHLCGCGNRGCLEQYGSGSALVRDARTAASGGSEQAASLLARAGGDVDAITGPLITAAAQEGDQFSVDLIASLARWLGQGIATLTAVLDPAAVVIGGGVSEAGDLLLVPMRAAFEAQLIAPSHRPVAEIRLATLGNKAGVIGAADLARR
jgi:glucokinase